MQNTEQGLGRNVLETPKVLGSRSFPYELPLELTLQIAMGLYRLSSRKTYLEDETC
jgi:hypothetical protein